MKADPETQFFIGTYGGQEINIENKADLAKLMIDYGNSEESLRNLLQHNGQASGNAKEDTDRQMHAYKNAIFKFRSHINVVERENHALKRQIASLASQTVGADMYNGETTEALRLVTHTPPSDMSQLEDIRSTCTMLSERIKRMEEQNNLLLMNAERQRCDYERCLDRVATQVFQALACQRRLQMECDTLRMQVHHLTGSLPGPVQMGNRSGEPSPGGQSSGSNSDDAFSPTGHGRFAYGPWYSCSNGYHSADSPRFPYSPTYLGKGDAHRVLLNHSEANNVRLHGQKLLENVAHHPYVNGHQSKVLSPPAQMDYQYERHQISPHRVQTAKSPPLRAIPESVEPVAPKETAHGLESRKNAMSRPTSLSDAYAAQRIAVDDESVGRVSRSRDRQRSVERNKVSRSRSFDGHSPFARSEQARVNQATSPPGYDGVRSYRPGPPVHSVPGKFQTARQPRAYAPEEVSRTVISQNTAPNKSGHPAEPSNSDLDKSKTCTANLSETSGNDQLSQMASEPLSAQTQNGSVADVKTKANSHGSSNTGSQERKIASSRDLRNSFRVTRPCERRLDPGLLCDDVWLRRGRDSNESPSVRTTDLNGCITNKQLTDLPPPPPPPPKEDPNSDNDENVSLHREIDKTTIDVENSNIKPSTNISENETPAIFNVNQATARTNLTPEEEMASVQQVSISQHQRPRGRIPKKSNKRVAPKPPCSNEEKKENLASQRRIGSTGSCEGLTSNNHASAQQQRRLSEGVIRSQKQSQPSNLLQMNREFNTNDTLRRDDNAVSAASEAFPPSTTNFGPFAFHLSSADKPVLTSFSHHDISAKGRSPSGEKRIIASSQPNLAKLGKSNAPKDRRFFSDSGNFYEENLAGRQCQEGSENDKKDLKLNSPSYAEGQRSHKEKFRNNDTKPSKQHKGSDPVLQSDGNGVKVKDVVAKTETKTEGKKKAGSQKSFVDVMKSKFGGKGSSTKKTVGHHEKQEITTAKDITSTAIDPRTLSLEPNSFPPANTGRKLSKKSGQDPIGRKLSRPFLTSPAEKQEKENVGPKVGGPRKKSFLNRSNSKRDKGLRMEVFEKGEQFNNCPYGRVELIPVGTGPVPADTAETNQNDLVGDAIEIERQETSPALAGDSSQTEKEICRSRREGKDKRLHNDYENVVLLSNNPTKNTERFAHSYENVLVVNASRPNQESDKSSGPSQKNETNAKDITKEETAKPTVKQATPLQRLWSSLSSHSLNKLLESENGSRGTLHEIGGGLCVSNEGNSGKKSNVYADEQRMFEKAFISSVVEAELIQREENSGETEKATQEALFVGSSFEKGVELKQESSAENSLLTESGKSSMVFSTNSSSKSGNSGFGSWPTKYAESYPRGESRQGGSLDASFKNLKSVEEIVGKNRQSCLKTRPTVGSGSSLGSFGYGSGVSITSSTSSNKSGGRSPVKKTAPNSEEQVPRSRQDSSSDNDLTPTPQTSSLQTRYAEHRYASQMVHDHYSKIQKPRRIPKPKTGFGQSKVKMGISSIPTPTSYRESFETSNPELPQNGPKKQLSASQVARSIATEKPSKQLPEVSGREPRKTVPMSRGAYHISPRSGSQHTSIPMRYSASKQ